MYINRKKTEIFPKTYLNAEITGVVVKLFEDDFSTKEEHAKMLVFAISRVLFQNGSVFVLETFNFLLFLITNTIVFFII